MENNEQLYVEVGSNIYLGTKDGIKYSLMQTPDSKFRLVEAPSDSSISLSDSSGYVNKHIYILDILCITDNFSFIIGHF